MQIMATSHYPKINLNLIINVVNYALVGAAHLHMRSVYNFFVADIELLMIGKLEFSISIG